MCDMPKTIRVAAAQLPAHPLERAADALADIEQAVAAAAGAGASLVVLPECCYPCYWLIDKDRYFAADLLRGGALDGFFADLARRRSIAIIAGLVQEEGRTLFDSAVLYDASGRVVARYHKTFLWDREHDWYAAGSAVKPADAVFGRTGMVVCAEGRSPEVFATHAAAGAALLAMPTAWVNAATAPGEYYNPQPDFLAQARSLEFGLPMICANKFGQECEEARFCGMSMIIAADGRILSKAAPDGPALLVAEITAAPRRLLLVDATARRLLAATPPVLPPRDAAALRVALLPATPPAESLGSLMGSLAARNVHLALRCTADPALEEADAALGKADPALEKADPALEKAAAEANLPLLSPARAPALRRIANVSVGTLTGLQACSFAIARLHALSGAQVLHVTGDLPPEPILRARAVENRVFVLAADNRARTAIAPTGAILAAAPAGPDPLVVDLDLAQAGEKRVAPQTDIWGERRVGAYGLAR